MTGRLEISPEKMAVYRATARRRQKEEKQAQAERRERAWELARQAAALLRERFAATKVVVFGSLAHQAWFGPRSDIDLAAWGLQDEHYFIAVARLQDLSPEFKVDLVQMEACPPALKEAVLKEGLEL